MPIDNKHKIEMIEVNSEKLNEWETEFIKGMKLKIRMGAKFSDNEDFRINQIYEKVMK